MNRKNKFLILIATCTLSGCGAFGIDGRWQNSHILQAEDRMLLVTDKAEVVETKPVIDKNGRSVNYSSSMRYKRVVCAEPSPDAMSALAFSGALKAPIEGVPLELSAASSEAISSLGERTPVIQLLRDSLYRACEAHMNGLLNKDEYDRILKMFDVYSATLMAIEAITRQPRPADMAKMTASATSTSTSTKKPDDKAEDNASAANGTQAAGQEPDTGGAVTINYTATTKEVASEVKAILANYYKQKNVMDCVGKVFDLKRPLVADEIKACYGLNVTDAPKKPGG